MKKVTTQNAFQQFKLWDVYRFKQGTQPKECSLDGRVIDITNEYIVFGFRDVTSNELKKVNLRPIDINASRIPDPEIQNRKRLFSLIDKLSGDHLTQCGFKYLLKLPSLTNKELAFINSAELYFTDDVLQKLQRSNLEATYKL